MKQAFGLRVPESVEEAIDRQQAALIVYDMQVGILRQMKDGAAIVAQVAQVVAVAREVGLRTVFLRHLSMPKPSMGVFQLRQALAWQRKTSIDEVHPWFLRDSEGQQIVPELTPTADEAVFDKIGMSAFEGTPLDTVLRDCGVRTIILVGVATEIGLEPTVRHASDLGYVSVLVEDACGAGHPEAGERAMASLRFMGDAMFTRVDALSAMLRR